MRALPHHLLLDTREPESGFATNWICLTFGFVCPPIEDDGPVAAVHVEEGRVDHGTTHGQALQKRVAKTGKQLQINSVRKKKSHHAELS